MTAFNVDRTIGVATTNYDLYVAGTVLERADVVLDKVTGYVPAVADILCYKTDDSNKHMRYDETDAALVIMGVIDEIIEDETSPADVILIFAVNASCHYSALGKDAVNTAAKKLTLVNALRAKNINAVG